MSDQMVIVGGGFAGLAAGVALAQAGCRVRLLEQKPHLGGRALSFFEPTTGSVVDNGQHIFMGCYRATLRFLATIGTLDRVRFQPRLALNFLDENARLTSLECADLPAPWHLLLGVLRSGSLRWREKFEMVRLGRVLGSGKAPRADTELLSVAEWLSRLGQSESLRRNFWDLLCIAAMNESSQVASAAILERVLRPALFSSPEDSRLGIARVGLSDCYTHAARAYIEARGGQVELGQDVSRLLVTEGVCKGVEISKGETIEARTVLSAVPWFGFVRLVPGDLLRAEPFFTNVLALRPAPIISINLWFDRPITDLEFVGLRGTAVQWLFNKGKILGSNGGYVSLVLSAARAHIGQPKQELVALALHELGSLMPLAREAKLIHSLVIKERYATFSPCVGVEEVRPPAQTPVRGLYLAGDWTATGLPGTIEGAVRSGHVAAKEILQQD